MIHRRTLPLLLTVLLLSGCMSTRQDAVTTPQHTTETVTFTASQPRLAALDAATASLVTHNFTITLANDRLGLLQTDYVPLSTLPLTTFEPHAADLDLDKMLVRVVVNTTETEAGTVVELSGTFQRLGSTGAANETLLGLYSLDALATTMAQRLDADYVPQAPPSRFAEVAGGNTSGAPAADNRPGLRRSGRALGIVGVIAFSATLIAGAFGPSSAR